MSRMFAEKSLEKYARKKQSTQQYSESVHAKRILDSFQKLNFSVKKTKL